VFARADSNGLQSFTRAGRSTVGYPCGGRGPRFESWSPELDRVVAQLVARVNPAVIHTSALDPPALKTGRFPSVITGSNPVTVRLDCSLNGRASGGSNTSVSIEYFKMGRWVPVNPLNRKLTRRPHHAHRTHNRILKTGRPTAVTLWMSAAPARRVLLSGSSPRFRCHSHARLTHVTEVRVGRRLVGSRQK